MKMIFVCALLLGTAGLSTALHAQEGKSATCTSLAAAVENALKIASSEHAETIGDSSAPRMTAGQLKVSNQLAVAAINLQLMRDNNCPVRQEPVSASRYLVPALQCKTDMMRIRLGEDVPKVQGSTLPSSCNMDTWTPTTSSEKQ